MNDDPVSLPDLVAAVADAMATWPAPTNGQVRALPDLRTLRWYGTIGLLDKPVAWRGRTALYGARHVHQVLAIKRLQLAGWPIAAIQQRLYGVDDAALIAVADDETPAAAPPVMADAMTPVALEVHIDAAESEGAVARERTELPPAALAPSPSPKRRRDDAFWVTSTDAPPPPPIPVAVARQHIALGAQAELVLPAGVDIEGLEQALAPLRVWLAAHGNSSVFPDVTATSPKCERTP